MEILGQNLMVSGYLFDGDPLGDETRLKQVLHEVCRTVEMRALGELSLTVASELSKIHAEPFEDEGGSTAVLVLSTSHAAIHGWPARKYFQFSLSSCREFDEGVVVDVLVEELGIEYWSWSTSYFAGVEGVDDEDN